jgi:hypothetical protein
MDPPPTLYQFKKMELRKETIKTEGANLSWMRLNLLASIITLIII